MTDLDDLQRWLVLERPIDATAAETLHGFLRRLSDRAGVIRANLLIRPLSPEVSALLHMWRPTEREDEVDPTARVVDHALHHFEGGVVRQMSLAYGAFDSEAFRESPFHRIIVGGDPMVRCRVEHGRSAYDFPLLKDLADQGATDYLALPIQFPGTALCAISLATQRPGGFLDAEVQAIQGALRAFVLALAPAIDAYTMRGLLGAYLGPATGERVLAGRVRRGDVEEIDAAIWFSDLRGFTPMSAGIPSRELIAWLNEYFGAIALAITRHHGEILKFIGDAILATWPVTAERPRTVTCRAALAAARDANLELAALNASREARGLARLEHGIGLHVGRVQYGNIGAEGRLDFTVIGNSVNLASRLEGACASMSRSIVASADLAACAGEDLVPLGEISLKGIAEPQPVFGVVETWQHPAR
jgi:adenylate cyclase